MKRICAFLLSAPLFGQAFLPNQYIVELSADPVSVHAGGRRSSALHSATAESHRALVRSQQDSAAAAIRRLHGAVIGRAENVANALIVELPDAQTAGLSAIPGVRIVHPVRKFQLFLDHALALHRAIDAWNQVGPANAGAGIKVAIIDTGIDIGHPGFSDASFSAPAGFPIADSMADVAFTNNKVIVARSYAAMFAAPDPDPSPADHVGHGTATAMAAAGVMNSGPLATIAGVAPRAFLGNYKVFGTPGVNDSAPESAVLQAIEDAVTDGMDVISLSLGSSLAERLELDPEVRAIQQANSLGVVVVVSAGNNGPDPATIASPADAPSALAVGATNNDRIFAGTLAVPGGSSLVAVPGASANSTTPISANLSDVAALDPSGLACSGFPAGSLAGAVALIFRGTCTFETKLNNAQAAGAIAAVVYDNVPGEDPVTMGVGAATLPAAMVSNADGLSLKSRLAAAASAGFGVTLSFALAPGYSNPARIASFSARGPNVDSGVKPDLMAVGMNLYTAAQKLDPNGVIYDPSGYALEQGTSFSAPLVAGAAALLKQARPGLTVDEYRSLLVNSAAPASLVPGTPADVQQSGAGVLDVLASLNATAAVAPVSLTFGIGGGTINSSLTLTLTNVGSSTDTFQISVAPSASGAPAPQPAPASVQLDPGASASIAMPFQANGLAAGVYDGFVVIQASLSSVATRAPYWYAVASGEPAHITVLYSAGSNGPQTAGAQVSQAAVFRVSDVAGAPVAGITPVVTALSEGARASAPGSIDAFVPGAFTFDARLSTTPGANIFQIQAGGVTATVTIMGQ